MKYYTYDDRDYYWDGKYWRDKEGVEASEEDTRELSNTFAAAKDEVATGPWDRVLVFRDKEYGYDQGTEKFTELGNFTQPPKEIEVELNKLLVEPEEAIPDFPDRDSLIEAANEAKDNLDFSKVERICKVGIGRYSVNDVLAAMLCRSLREQDRPDEAVAFSQQYKDKNWPRFLSSRAGAQMDIAETVGDYQEVKQTLSQLEHAIRLGGSGANPQLLKRLQSRYDKLCGPGRTGQG